MSASATVPKLDNTFGALFLGVILAVVLWGASSVQVYCYFEQYPKDRWQLKLLVVVVYFLDTAHQGLITYMAYKYLVTNFFNPDHLGVIESSLRDMVALNFVIIAIVQGFFLYRVFRLSQRNYCLVGVLAILSLAQFISIVVYYIKVYHMKRFSELSSVFIYEKALNIISAVSDLSIAATLVFLLRESRSQSSFKKTRALLNKWIMFSIRTGMITSTCAIMAFISIVAWPDTFWYMPCYLLISRLYVNSLLATLNARTSLAEIGTHQDFSPTTLSQFHLSRLSTVGEQFRAVSGPVSIKIDTETHLEHDVDSDSVVGNLLPKTRKSLTSSKKEAKHIRKC